MEVTLKKREIYFSPLHPDKNQAQSALLLFEGISGVLHLQAVDPLQLHIQYDIQYLTLVIIEDTLKELGFHLDNSLIIQLKRALFHYTEETERANLGCDRSQDQNTRDIFIHRYRNQNHGCRDHRPQHWRDYL
ncbi:MAG: hypothetical protein OQK73_02310 [Gammaproteobacteria bacterium]|nr:hypothetical protein [Gammaproteobacteria bacterium]